MDEAGATDGAPTQEPSIEEILASIRRIISDDGEEGAASEGEEMFAEAEPEAAAEPEPEIEPEPELEPEPEPMIDSAFETAEEEVLDLTERVEPARPPVEERPAPRAKEPRAVQSDYDDDRLVSEPVAQRATDVLARLSPRGSDHTDDPLPIPHRTLEEVVRELLKPMLREWLDTYLPGIVERAVERELRRIGRSADELH
jgi:cell pole-organizing protein PopZ